MIELLHKINEKLGAEENARDTDGSGVKERYTRKEAMELYEAKEKEM